METLVIIYYAFLLYSSYDATLSHDQSGKKGALLSSALIELVLICDGIALDRMFSPARI
ncbi:MAG: hypothetical protein M3Y39_20480 [Chloroflexota bacterium]|nr:hypothetical protein [Chloroflexota bacterium]